MDQAQLAAITPAQVERVYSGRQGCMCGCLGKYSEDARNVKRILNILKSDTRTQIQDGYILYTDFDKVRDGERNYVVYLKQVDKKLEAM